MTIHQSEQVRKQAKVTLNAMLALLAATSTLFAAALWAQSSSDFAAAPALLQSSAPPRVMLLLSNDHQLYFKAYTDYTDLDGDGELETSYNDDFDYYGYFNSGLCYEYTNNRYEPNGPVSSGHKCSGEWSGNFLNWATMTRMDIVRRVYYGGKRSIDTAGETELQRAFIPNDAHSFVKVHSGDVADYTPYNYSDISLCNTTLHSGFSRDVDASANPPLLRVADGRWRLWSTTERAQCMYKGETSASGEVDRPPSGDQYIVRLLSCVDGMDANVDPVPGGEDYCRSYGATGHKPAGILQQNSEDGSIQFGLMTGTHMQKMSGGILRRNITPLAGNSNPNDDEVDLSNGRFRYLDGSGFSGGIIQTLDSMRIAAWDPDANFIYEDCNTPGIKVPAYKAIPTGSSSCKDWGNPLAEMYMEALRYFAANGNSPINAFSADDDSGYLDGMGTESWQDPLSTAEPCAQCSIIVMSTGLNSFDADELGLVSGLPGIGGLGGDIESRTDAIGVNEGLVGSMALVGNIDGLPNDNSCTPKQIGDFSDVLGICPELPSLEGGFNLAGLASYAQTTDLRPEAALPDRQNVNTYTISLAESLPSFLFTTADGSEIGLAPSCQSSPQGLGDWSDCSIVNAVLVSKTPFYTRIDLAWEDSLWGNDYDLDGLATMEICTATGTAALTECQYQGAVPVSELDNYPGKEWKTNTAASELQVRISVPQAFAGFDLEFGYMVGGSLNDGSNFNLLRPGDLNYSCLMIGACSDTAKSSMVWAEPELITAGSSAAQFLENPLWYAAKYGNFKNSESKLVPTDTSEWDNLDLDGNPNPDGLPDAYFPVRNPGQLAARLQNIITDIEKRAASGTSVAVTLERRDGVGATFQAYYFPSFSELGTNPREVTWVGGLHALFLDGDLNLREDTNNNATLDGADTVIELFFNGDSTVVQRMNADGSIASTVPFTQIKPIWDAKDWLAGLTNAQVVPQRAYTNTLGRHILTWMDRVQTGDVVPDGDVDANEVVAFTPANVAAGNNYRILGTSTEAEGDALIDYVRGSETAGKRSRTIRFDGDATDSVWRLGDIVHSSPVIVGRPGDEYDIDYRDGSYTTFRNRYLDRRQVVYAGGNDGMIHAFNAGFYQQGSSTFATAATHPISGADLAEYDLGAELWAYVPRNLLPHLRWLAEANYPHVFYVDGEPRVYDVNIFTPDTTHPEGWGTILVVGFRFGGGDVSLDLDGDGSNGNEFTSRSAYVVLDVTDPEQPPRLLAEISDPRLGFTTGIPTLVNGRLEDLTTGLFNHDEDAWYLVFGSGPAGTDATSKRNALLKGVSNQNARLYIYDLVAGQFVDTDAVSTGVQAAVDTGVANSFVGDLSAEDWDLNYLDDAVYFGLVEGTDPGSPSGSLNRLMFTMNFTAGSAPSLALANSATSTLLDPNLPFQGAPVTFRDLSSNRHWVLAGTGRFLTAADNVTDYANRFYGVLEPLNTSGDFSNAAVTEASLADTTTLVVLDDNTVFDLATGTTPATVNAGGSGTVVNNFSELMTVARTAGGWFNELGPLVTSVDINGVPTLSQESRNYNGAVSISSGVGFVKYAPNQSVCTPSGHSSLRFVDSRTGTASRNIFFDTALASLSLNVTGDTLLLNAESGVQQGAISKLTVIRTKDGTAVGSSDNYGGIKFDDIGSLSPLSRRQSWRELPIYQ